MFGRKKNDADVTSAPHEDADPTQGKGRATPSRREAQEARDGYSRLDAMAYDYLRTAPPYKPAPFPPPAPAPAAAPVKPR